MNIEDSSDFGRVVRTARKEAGLSQAQLAMQCGCSQRFVSEVERGKRTAELEKCLKLLRSLGVPLVAGRDAPIFDGRAEVNYAVVRVAESLDAKPRRRRGLASYLKEHDNGS